MNLDAKVRRMTVGEDELAVCWLGQAGFLLKDASGKQLVIDPYLTDCGERIRGFKRLSPILLLPEQLKPDYYIVTHLHFDHFDYDAIPLIGRRPAPPLFLGPASCQEKLREIGVDAGHCRRLDWGECYQDPFVTIRSIRADHGDMAPDAIGVFVEMGGCRLYFSGDTAFHEEIFRQVGGLKPDIAFLSVNGRFGNMNSAEGAEAARLCGVRYAVPCHFWTFAEHGGDPGEFCRLLEKDPDCGPLCFRQGEIKVIDKKEMLPSRKETA